MNINEKVYAHATCRFVDAHVAASGVLWMMEKVVVVVDKGWRILKFMRKNLLSNGMMDVNLNVNN